MIEKQPLITHMYTADPSVHVFNGKLYIYPSHDLDLDIASNDNGDQYMMEDYHVFRMEDMTKSPVDCGEILNVKNVKWAKMQMWDCDCAEKDGKYYLYFPARDKDGMFRFGVAVADKPEGPFIPEDNYMKGSYSIDLCAFKEDDGSYYLTFGGIWGGQLDQYRNNVWDKNNKESEGDVPAVCPKIVKLAGNMKEFAEDPKDLVIVDKDGQPLKGRDHNRRFFEASWLFKKDGKYYFTYSTGDTHLLCWAVSDKLYGPYSYGGVILTPVLGWTTHHSIVQYKNQWYLFYHDCELSKGIDNKRNLKFCKLQFDADGGIVPVDGSIK